VNEFYKIPDLVADLKAEYQDGWDVIRLNLTSVAKTVFENNPEGRRK
jgi:hypothetical protein